MPRLDPAKLHLEARCASTGCEIPARHVSGGKAPVNSRESRFSGTAHSRLVAIALLLLVMAPSAWAGDADPFAALHARLNQAAEQSLASLQAEQAAATSAMLPDVARSPSSGQPALAGVRMLTQDVPESRLAGFARRYWNGREQQARQALERVRAHRAVLDPILRAEGVPLELASVVLVESAGNVAALSPAGARGLWQFIPETARRYGLEVGAARDDRLDVERATRAAARHLRDLHARFGDWELALAAYNAGAQAVERAIARARSRDFARLALPAETRNYVPAVLAAADLFGEAEVFRHPPITLRRAAEDALLRAERP